MKKTLRLRRENMVELGADDLRGVAGAFSGWDPCGWPVNSARTCWSVCELTCVICQ